MNEKLTVVLDGQAVVEYDRTKELPDQQLTYLDKMDEGLDKGITIGGETIDAPDIKQKSQFVALQLFQGLQTENDAIIAASCAYLATRLPDLKQVVGKSIEGHGVACDLVFDKPFVQEAQLQFMKPH
ncbi:MAG: hypothetical protein HUJ29_06555 [Gammaproteobacteria bacterium]|nr:hypothetical protein [Gammaproteobacteria bacterium]